MIFLDLSYKAIKNTYIRRVKVLITTLSGHKVLTNLILTLYVAITK